MLGRNGIEGKNKKLRLPKEKSRIRRFLGRNFGEAENAKSRAGLGAGAALP
jgi:hypothetical protein